MYEDDSKLEGVPCIVSKNQKYTIGSEEYEVIAIYRGGFNHHQTCEVKFQGFSLVHKNDDLKVCGYCVPQEDFSTDNQLGRVYLRKTS